jgi:hypothetical protein
VLPGTYRGAQAILEFFGRVAQESAGTLRVEPEMMAASGDRVFVQERLPAKRKGKTIDTKSPGGGSVLVGGRRTRPLVQTAFRRGLFVMPAKAGIE